MNHLSHKLKCRHVNYSYQIHKCCSGHETLIESIKYMPTSWTICSFYFSMLARFGHITWPIIIAALDTGFKMCHWSVIDVISQPAFFFLQHLIFCFIDHRNVFMAIHSSCFCPHKHTVFTFVYPLYIFNTGLNISVCHPPTVNFVLFR